MFGYVTVNRKDMTEPQRALYRSYYCGICRELRERHGFTGKLTLSYDTVFLALLLTDLYDREVEPEKMFCPLHPARRCGKACNELTAYAADLSVILAYFACLDHWQDEGSRLCRSAAGRLEKQVQAAARRWPRQYEAVKNGVEQLAQAEKDGETDLDRLASFTGTMLAELFVKEEDPWSEDLRGMGFFLGKFIYFLDAYDDLKRDGKKGCFNPFTPYQEKADFEEKVRSLLTEMMGQCAVFFEHLPLLEYADLLRNVIYSGVWVKYYEVYERRNRKKLADRKDEDKE